MSELQTAIAILIKVFREYSGKEGDSKNLSKGELKELLQKELLISMDKTADKSPIDKLFNQLDCDKSSSVDFKEYVSFVACMAAMLEEDLCSSAGRAASL